MKIRPMARSSRITEAWRPEIGKFLINLSDKPLK